MRSTRSWTITRAFRWRGLLLLAAIFVGACGGSENPAVSINPAGVAADASDGLRERVTVSGVSSGAYMAVQTHIALADRVSGAGIVAGGPYHCAAGSVGNALGRCMSGENLDVSELVSFTHAAAAAGDIAAIESLRDARVWIFRGARDAIVASAVTIVLADYYREFLPGDQVMLVDDVDTVHGWPTLDEGSDCLEMGGDFINACGFDTAGNLLSHLYGNLNPPNTYSLAGELRNMEFSKYFDSGSGVSDAGYIYVPENCQEANSSCRLHVAFHGCRQGAEFIGDRFAIASGLNAWAIQNQIVVVYPQIQSALMNPQGCWDWWGYTGAQYDLHAGKQITGVNAIIDAFANGMLVPPG